MEEMTVSPCRRVASSLACLAGLLGCQPGLASGGGQVAGEWAPSPVTAEDVKAMVENSPFTRPLNLSDSLILTGIASLGGELVATLLDKNSKETYVVTGQPNAQGWKMVGVQGNSGDLDKVTAKISVPGGEVVAVRFDEKQLKPGEAKPAAGQAPGPGDWRGPRPPGQERGRYAYGFSPEIREKFAKLNEEQRRSLFEKMKELGAKSKEMPREEIRRRMGELFNRELEQAEKSR